MSGYFNSAAIEVSDLLDLLTVYGGICLLPQDLDGDRLVQVNDLLNLLTLYGSANSKNFWLCCTFIFAFACNLSAQPTLTIEDAPAVGAGGTVYRFYVNSNDPTDKISAVYGNDNANLIINTPSGIFNSPYNAGWNAAGVSSLFLGVFPDLADDSYATIGLSGPATEGAPGSADPSLVEDAAVGNPVSTYFIAGGMT